MKKYFDKNGHEFQTPPDPFHGRSPMHNPDGSYKDDAFREMGGVIVDGGCQVITSAGTTVSLAAGTYTKINNDGTTA